MKKMISLILACSLLISGCSQAIDADFASLTASSITEEVRNVVEKTLEAEEISKPEEEVETSLNQAAEVVFERMDDPKLLRYLEDTIYLDLVSNLDSADYFVENIKAIYISKEYLEETAYNSLDNIYFGYKISEFDEPFEESKYIFTLGEDGTTIVKMFEEYDDTYERLLQNIVSDAGVIIIHIIISPSILAELPNMYLNFTLNPSGIVIHDLSSCVIDFVLTAAVRFAETKDIRIAIKDAFFLESKAWRRAY